jgi:predicted phage-related endonuclease
VSNIPISERVKWLGGSESAALFNESPFVTSFELWHMKAGNIPAHNLDMVERIQAGKFLEPGIAAWASHKWNWPIRKVDEYRVNPNVARMGASLDFEAIDGHSPVEIKNCDFLEFREKWQHEGDTITDAPAHYLIQLQHELSCSPLAKRGWLVVSVGGNKLYRMEVNRHDAMIERLEEEVAEFWLSIEKNEPPTPDFQRDYEAISTLYKGQGQELVDLRGNARALELAIAYRKSLDVETAAEKAKKAAMGELKKMLNDGQGAILDDGWKLTASHIKEATYTVNREAYWRFSLTKPKEKKQ